VLPSAKLKALLVDWLGRVRDLERQVAARDAEIARLKGLKGRPDIKPSGMEQAPRRRSSRQRGRAGAAETRPRVAPSMRSA
jgi:hypothetical protein